MFSAARRTLGLVRLFRHQQRVVRHFSAPPEGPPPPPDYIGFVKRNFKKILMVVGGVGAVGGYYPPLKDLFKDAIDLVPHAIDKSKVVLLPEDKKTYVPRPALEQELSAAFTDPPTGAYTVIYGAKGVGKSSVVKHVAADREGVVRLVVNDALSPESIVSQLTVKLTGKEERVGDVDKLVEAIQRCKVVPTIIFDVDRGETSEQVRGLSHVRSVCKHLAESCRCFIVLSEANAVTEFGNDPDRETFVFVDELAATEAKQLLDLQFGLKLKQNPLSEDTMNHVFKTIGTNAARLKKLASHVRRGGSVDEFVQKTLKKRVTQLKSFPFQKILKALKEHPDGVSPGDFEGEIEKEVELHNEREVMKVAKKHNVILYHESLDQYQLVSTAHKTALKTYNIPKQPKPWFF